MKNGNGIEAIGGKSFDMLEKVMRIAQFRQKVLSSNIANADTPGYRAKDTADFKTLLGQASGGKLEMATTNSSHIAPKTSVPDVTHVQVRNTEPWDDKNNVELDVEVSKMNENSLMYDTGVRLITQKLNSYKQAVRGR